MYREFEMYRYRTRDNNVMGLVEMIYYVRGFRNCNSRDDLSNAGVVVIYSLDTSGKWG